MRLTKPALGILASTMVLWTDLVTLYAQTHPMDAVKSSVTIRVSKSGFLSAFGHDHEIQAPVESGTIDSSADPKVQLHVDARKLRVLDPDVAAEQRAEIQHTMEGSAVLDAEHFPDIFFQSTSVTKTGNERWEVRGNLDLHGKKQPVVLEVSLDGSHYRGSASFKQSDFGINPVRIAGGTVRVKDEIEIEFDIVPAQ
jgi:polyisoprenoid-binding protein YceI